MPIEHVAGADDPRIADYRDVAEPELVRSRGLLVAEGRLVVRRLIEDGRFIVRSLLVTDTALRSLEPATLNALPPAVPIYVGDARVLLGITGHDIHRGCLALAERPVPMTLDDLVAQDFSPLHPGARLKPCATVVVLEAVTNADNVGGVFRNAAAFGAHAVLLSPSSCDPLYRKAIRTSMAATLRIPFARVEPWPDRLETLRAAGFSIVALTPREPALTLDAFALGRPEKIALLLGTEGDGLSAAAASMADVRVRIPISPDVESLNLAVAAGIALHALRGVRL